MGNCASTRARLANVDLSTAKGGMQASQTVGGGGPAEKQTCFILQQRSKWAAGLNDADRRSHNDADQSGRVATGDFDIFDQLRNPVYHVSGVDFTVLGVDFRGFGFHDKMVISDSKTGDKICMMKKKLLSHRWVPNYKVYVYKPVFEGQESTDTDSDIPVYLFAAIKAPYSFALFGFPQKFNYELFSTSNEVSVPTWTGELMSFYSTGEFEHMFGYSVVVDKTAEKGVPGECIGRVGQTSAFQLENSSEYAVQIAEGADPIGMLCLGIAAEQLRPQAVSSLLRK